MNNSMRKYLFLSLDIIKFFLYVVLCEGHTHITIDIITSIFQFLMHEKLYL